MSFLARANGNPALPGSRPPLVVIIQRYLPQYRVPFFNHLRQELQSKGVDLDLIYGQPFLDEQMKGDASEVAWGHSITNRTVGIGHRKLVWQPCFRKARKFDLVIVEQASKLMINYLLLVRQFLGGPKVAMWGHGIGFRGVHRSGIGEALKRRVSKHPHWWFAYNDASAASVRALGYPPGRITVVENAIDSSKLEELGESISPHQLDQARASLDIRSDNVGIYLGAIYKEKRPSFLLESLREIRALVPTFEAIVVGAGPDQEVISNAAATESWIHYIGPSFDAEKVAMLKLSKVMLMPGRVGLAIIDSFVLQTPLVTVAGPYHAPEIAYLDSGSNGIILPDHTTPSQYAQAVASLLREKSQLEHLKDGCKKAAKYYTLEGMVRRFSEGVMKALRASGDL